MSRIRSKDTKPEITVRRIVHRFGYRYRLHCRDLIGKPDLVFPRLRKAIFVNGCFWHRHNCARFSMPKSRVAYWALRFQRNVERDKRNLAMLKREGWKVLTIWECEIREIDKLRDRLSRFLRSSRQ